MALEVLDTLWLDLDAKYMDFPRVLRIVRQHVLLYIIFICFSFIIILLYYCIIKYK